MHNKKGSQIDIAALDFSKAFDPVPVVVVVYPLPWPLLVGGVRCSRLWSTSQLLRPSGQQCSNSGGVCPQIQRRQCGAYVGAVPHDGLLSKLKHCDIDETIWLWIYNFLKNQETKCRS